MGCGLYKEYNVDDELFLQKREQEINEIQFLLDDEQCGIDKKHAEFMYEEFYKNDDEMYVYFNITYNDLVKAFRGVVTRPDTVLKTHEKLLNKFQNNDAIYSVLVYAFY